MVKILEKLLNIPVLNVIKLLFKKNVLLKLKWLLLLGDPQVGLLQDS